MIWITKMVLFTIVYPQVLTCSETRSGWFPLVFRMADTHSRISCKGGWLWSPRALQWCPELLDPGGKCIKIGLSGKSILRDYFQEKRTFRGALHKIGRFRNVPTVGTNLGNRTFGVPWNDLISQICRKRPILCNAPQWRIFQWRVFQKTPKMLILNKHRHHKMRYFGKFWLNSLNLVPFLLLNPVHGRKNTKLTTDSVVNFVFFETLATEKSATAQ